MVFPQLFDPRKVFVVFPSHYYVMLCKSNRYKRIQTIFFNTWEMERQTPSFDKWFLDRKQKAVKKKIKKRSAVATRIRTPNVTHNELALTTLCVLLMWITWSRKVLIIYVCFVQSHTSLLTEQNDLAVFDNSTRKICTDTDMQRKPCR